MSDKKTHKKQQINKNSYWNIFGSTLSIESRKSVRAVIFSNKGKLEKFSCLSFFYFFVFTILNYVTFAYPTPILLVNNHPDMITALDRIQEYK
jgi:hypothetical protein